MLVLNFECFFVFFVLFTIFMRLGCIDLCACFINILEAQAKDFDHILLYLSLNYLLTYCPTDSGYEQFVQCWHEIVAPEIIRVSKIKQKTPFTTVSST